jgi:hypothetical protein
MNAIARIAALGLLAGVVAGCATGPKYEEVRGGFPALVAEQGRIYFYRSSNPIGSGIQPSVMLNGQKVGDSKPGGFFFVDRAPGNYEVNLTTEVDKKLTFTLEPRQERYVRMSVGLGVVVYRVYPELVDRKTGEEELKGLSYTGQTATAK